MIILFKPTLDRLEPYLQWMLVILLRGDNDEMLEEFCNLISRIYPFDALRIITKAQEYYAEAYEGRES